MGIGVAVAVIGALTLLAAASSFLPHILKTPKHTRILGSLQLLAGECHEDTRGGGPLPIIRNRVNERRRRVPIDERVSLTVNASLSPSRESEREREKCSLRVPSEGDEV